MISKLTKFQNVFNNHQIKLSNKGNKIIKDFTCYIITEKSQSDSLQELVNKSEIIIIDKIGEPNDQYFVIFIDKAIIFIQESEINLFSNLFIKEKRYFTIIASPKINKEQLSQKFHFNFCENIINEYEKENYNKNIKNFSENLSIFREVKLSVKEIWELILPSFSAHFIQKSYQKLEQNKISETKIEIKELNEDEYIELRLLGKTYTSSAKLIYHIELEQLFVLKSYYDSECKKLYERELKNYERICHPSLPRLYGKIEKGRDLYLIIEYIRGQSLEKIKTIKPKLEEKINFIFQIMFIIEYLQNESLIHRDLKPNNFIIDEEKRVILIDFDRMIGIEEHGKPKEELTNDFNNQYQAPEVRNVEVLKYTYEEDVYSLGLLIYFIYFEKDPEIIEEEKIKQTIYPFNEFPSEYRKLEEICTMCTREVPSERPKITKIIDLFYNDFLSCIQQKIRNFDMTDVINNYNKNKYFPYWKLFYEYDNIEFRKQLGLFYSNENISHNLRKYIEKYSNYLNINHLIAQFLFGEEYYPTSYFSENIGKFIHFFLISGNSNNSKNPKSHLCLEQIFSKGKYISKDINKVIHYLTLAANQNNANAQNYLGTIYYEDKYISRDINKAIHYYSLAADQNNAIAQNNLGTLYYEGKYISRDINKAIHYYSLAADQNYANAQINLGHIYYEGKHISRDINKAIHYYSLAANQNNANAQFYLGIILLKGEYISRNTDKVIHYLTLAANQNNAFAQFLLGVIFFTVKYNHENAKKGRYYLMLASKNRFKEAHFHVGFLYHEGKYVDQDIEKAVHYYKEGSSFNDSHAKNNLGIIYKNGFHDKIQPKIGLAIEYFEEAIRQKNDKVSMYNLSNIYIYDERVNQNIDKSIEMLIKSLNLGFQPSLILLSIAVIKKVFSYNCDKIKEEIGKYKDTTEMLIMKIQQTIFCYNLYDSNIFKKAYDFYRNIEFLYDNTFHPIESNKIGIRDKNESSPGIKLPPPISSQFYEGFGIEI